MQLTRMTSDQGLLHRREEDGVNVAPESIVADASVASHRHANLTNEAVVSHLLKSGGALSVSVIQSTLDLLNDPGFYRPLVTLRNYSDVFAYDASARIEAAANRSRLASTVRKFPSVVLENIMDFVEKGRCIAAESDTPFAVLGDTTVGPDTPFAVLRDTTEGRTVQETLKNMSLVHRSWTRPAQKALGRELRLSFEESNGLQLFRKLLSSVHFGPWTKRAFVFYHQRTNREPERRNLNRFPQTATIVAEFDNELAKLLVEALKRLPNLQQAELHLPWFGIERKVLSRPYARILDQLSEHKQIHILRLSNPIFWDRTSSGAHFTRSLIELIAKLPSLAFLCASFKFKPLEPKNVIRDSDEDALGGPTPEMCPPPRSLRVLRVYHGYESPPGFLDWLFGAPQLQHLSLSLRPDKIHAIPPNWTSAHTIVAARANIFISLHTLHLYLGEPTGTQLSTGHPGAADVLVEILRSCASLRELQVELFKDVIVDDVLNNLPNSLTHLHYSHCPELHEREQQSSPELLDTTISQWLTNPAFRILHPYLSLISLSLKHSVIVDISKTYYTVPQDYYQRIAEGVPSPVLSRSMAASRDAGVELRVSWKKIVKPVYALEPGALW